MSIEDAVRLSREGRTATVIIHKPPLNILDIPMIQRLEQVLNDLTADRDLQVLILGSAAERGFSAGVSIQDHTPDKVGTMLDSFHGAIRRIHDLDAITIAAVHGHCLGGGMELALACDVVIATEDARFGQPEIELGCYPPAAAALYPGRFGYGLALDLLITGRTLPCEEAVRLGLVTRRVPTFGLDQEVARFVADVTAKSAAVTRLTKKAIRAGRDRGFAAGLTEAERIYKDELCATADMQEGLTAFVEKRRPEWKHR